MIQDVSSVSSEVQVN